MNDNSHTTLYGDRKLRSNEKRAQRLNYLLQFHLQHKDESKLLQRAQEMNIDISTAKDYCNTVLIQARHSMETIEN